MEFIIGNIESFVGLLIVLLSVNIGVVMGCFCWDIIFRGLK